MRTPATGLAITLGLALAACSPAEQTSTVADSAAAPAPDPIAAEAHLTALDDSDLDGTVRLVQQGDQVRISGQVDGLEEGQYGLHIHEGGACDDRGGHYNPDGTPHGGPDEPAELRHVGDLGNLVSRQGTARYERIDPVVQLDGETSVVGRVMVIHSGRDKLLPQPTGDAGEQIGCGLITSSHAQE